ncbi:MAG TPA: MFS transporter [Acetobacteraceae bacterium]|nr:MFS transporter [Acetobacteraceae bacterium]
MADRAIPSTQPDHEGGIFETDVPGRLDRLPWARFHTLVVVALGITWVLDGLEVTLVGSLSGAISESHSLRIGTAGIGYAASAYLAGAVAGAIFFGWLTDRLGRKKLFTITVAVYAAATVASGFAHGLWTFILFRAITGAGIGGEYAAVNATIQELIPARKRGFTDLCINGSFWLGAALGAVGALVALDPHVVPPDLGWRIAFVIGGVIGAVVLVLRRFIPESPRWLMTHGEPEEADRVVRGIEERVRNETGADLPPTDEKPLRLRRHHGGWFAASFHVLLRRYRRRTVVGVCLMGAQAFCYNAVFFTYALILTRFYHIPSGRIGLFILPFAAGNFAGPLLLGRLFDSIGRRIMIAASYVLSGILMAVVGWLFARGTLDATGQTVAWTIIFFFASAAASSAYLTVGETFPLEVRAVAISLFYAFGTGIGGIAGPALFGVLIASGSRREILGGYLLGGGLMVAAGIVQAVLGVQAERRSLETVAPPLSAA